MQFYLCAPEETLENQPARWIAMDLESHGRRGIYHGS